MTADGEPKVTTTPQSIDELLAVMVERDASDLHMTAGSPPVIRVNGRLERLLDYDKLTPGGDALARLPDHLHRAAEEPGDEAQPRLRALDPRSGALQGERVLPAREPCRSLPDDPRAHPLPRGAQHADEPVRVRRAASRARPRYRADRLGQVDDARVPARLTSTRLGTSTSSRSRIRSSSCTGTGRAS